MGNFMALRNQIAITFCLITIVSTGCTATTYQNVDTALLEQNKNKTFKLGLVKAVGDPIAGMWGSSGIEYKKKALENVPIAEICSILSTKYSITIDSNVDKTSKAVKEAMGSYGPDYGRYPSGNRGLSFSVNLQPSIDNAYYGNLEYDNASTLGIMVGTSSKIINNKEFPDVVNVTYSVDHSMLKESFYYNIDITSSEQEILKMRGLVGSTPATGSQEGSWNSYADYAGHISEALKKDLLEAANKPPEQPSHKEEL
jgi:hypothetical protein